MRFKLILVPFIFFIVACSKEDGVIEGQVIEENYNNFIEGVQLEVLELGNSISSSEKIVGSAKTDFTGRFILHYNHRASYVYQLIGRSTKLFNGTNSAEIKSRKTKKDFAFLSVTNLKFRVKNNQVNEIQLSIKRDDGLEVINGRLKINSKTDSILTNKFTCKGFGKTAFTYAFLNSQNQTLIIHDTISIFSKTDTIIHLIEIN